MNVHTWRNSINMVGLWSFRLILFDVVTCNKITVVKLLFIEVTRRRTIVWLYESAVRVYIRVWRFFHLELDRKMFDRTRKRLYCNKQWWFLFAAEEYELISSNIYLYSVIVACSNRLKSIVVCWSLLMSTETCHMGIIFKILLWSILIMNFDTCLWSGYFSLFLLLILFLVNSWRLVLKVTFFKFGHWNWSFGKFSIFVVMRVSLSIFFISYLCRLYVKVSMTSSFFDL